MTDTTAETKPVLFTANKLKAIELLAQGTKKTQVAEIVGIDRSTIHAWLHQSEFSDAVAEQQRRLEALILDPTPYLQGMIAWKQSLPDVMKAVAKTALDPGNPRQIRAAELIMRHAATDDFTLGPTDDEKVIQAFFEENGWVTHLESETQNGTE